MHLLKLAEEVKKGVQDAGLVGYMFNTIGVSDAISMGTDGMSYSLQSRFAQFARICLIQAGSLSVAVVEMPVPVRRLHKFAVGLFGREQGPPHCMNACSGT